jgi:hypothetical protein
MKQRPVIALLGLLCLLFPIAIQSAKKVGPAEEVSAKPVLWKDPSGSPRDLFYGIGGKEHAPPTEGFTFLEEDSGGSNPKFVVRDSSGTKWKVKLGPEAEPEVAASRFLWAAGYFTDEDYFLVKLRVVGVPDDLRRGGDLIDADGTMRKARLERQNEELKKVGSWKWKDSPFTGTREGNGLRALMALINNWDVKDSNTAIQRRKNAGGEPEDIYVVSDLGASFGTNGIVRGQEVSRGNLGSYMGSEFITKTTAEYVDFATPGRAPWMVLGKPSRYWERLHLTWIGKEVPREDARWLGEILARLSPDQIRDAFRAAGYSDADVDGFADTVQKRIRELAAL